MFNKSLMLYGGNQGGTAEITITATGWLKYSLTVWQEGAFELDVSFTTTTVTQTYTVDRSKPIFARSAEFVYWSNEIGCRVDGGQGDSEIEIWITGQPASINIFNSQR